MDRKQDDQARLRDAIYGGTRYAHFSFGRCYVRRMVWAIVSMHDMLYQHLMVINASFEKSNFPNWWLETSWSDQLLMPLRDKLWSLMSNYDPIGSFIQFQELASKPKRYYEPWTFEAENVSTHLASLSKKKE